jgi:hypothetical protein
MSMKIRGSLKNISKPNKLENLYKIDKFLHLYDLSESSQEDISHLNRNKANNEIEAVIVSQRKAQLIHYYQIFIEEFISIQHLSKLQWSFFTELEKKSILKLIWNLKAKVILMENSNDRDITISDFKLYYKDIVVLS